MQKLIASVEEKDNTIELLEVGKGWSMKMKLLIFLCSLSGGEG